MRSTILPTSLTIILVGCQSIPDPSAVFDGRAGQWIDLTYSFSSETICWPTSKPFELERVAFGPTDAGYFYAANNFAAAEHGGTHLDAPIHFAARGQTTDEIPLERLIGSAVVVDVTARIQPDYLISVDDFQEWETTHGPIPDGAILLLRTGWGTRWPDRATYLGTEQTGDGAVSELHFPGLDPPAARWHSGGTGHTGVRLHMLC